MKAQFLKASDLRQQNLSTLQTTLNDLMNKQFQLKMKQGSGQLATNHQIGYLRHDIARVKTIIHEMQKGESK